MIVVKKKHILIPTMYMHATNFFFSLPFHASFAYGLLGIIDTLAQAAKTANLEPQIS